MAAAPSEPDMEFMRMSWSLMAALMLVLRSLMTWTKGSGMKSHRVSLVAPMAPKQRSTLLAKVTFKSHRQ